MKNGRTALDIGRFGLVVTPIGSISSQLFVVPWIKKVGNQRAFQVPFHSTFSSKNDGFQKTNDGFVFKV